MSTRLKRLVSLSTALVLLFAAGAALDPLQRMREEYDLTNQPVEGLTPQLALATQVLGWGRGLIIDVIWIRMEALKMDDRYFELVQLADWACKLAPRFAPVWDIQSWNLAYNVSCRMSKLPDRWPWVWAGVELLRDQGIPQNPYSAMLYDRLAMLFYHKMGEQTDNANMFYKRSLGLLMHEIIGGEGTAEQLETLAKAPATREELLADSDVQRFHQECMVHGFDIVDGFFEFYKQTASVPRPIFEIVNRDYNLFAIRKTAAFARARRLREEMKMDVRLMLELREQYGPFDWRSPYPHAVYWATVGVRKLDELEARTVSKFESFGKEVPKPYEEGEGDLREGEGLYEFQRVTLERIIYASMQSLVTHGRVLFDTRGVLQLEVGPDYRFADATLPLYRKMIEERGSRFATGATEGLKNFLTRGLMEFYYTGDVRKSQAYFAMLKKDYPDEVRNRTYDAYRRAAMDYALQDKTTQEARRLVWVYLIRSLVALGLGNYNESAALEQQARDFATQWNEAEDNDGSPRMTVRFDRVRETAVVDVLTGRAGVSRTVYMGILRELRAQKSDAVDQILKNLQEAQVSLPTPEEVDDELKEYRY
ncbi:MAG: hypothetical protein GXY85_09755 [Candidatus Brocadiaceae bacterium]|nr:hypothetical protein [Candidatus Brocadiaceae bacterium]